MTPFEPPRYGRRTTGITTPFGYRSTVADVVTGLDLRGRRAIVTGGTSDIGVETARALASTGAEVTLAVRDTWAGMRVAAAIAAATGNDALEVRRLDLADQASVAAFARRWRGSLDILVNNAAATTPLTRRLTATGWEQQLGTNHLGHFALALGLHEALRAAGGARIVSVSSIAHRHAPLEFDDLHFDRRPYDAWQAYGQSKTANVLFALEATRRWRADGITVNALDPGGNAATSVLLATSPLLEGVGGRYFEECNEASAAPHAVERASAERLWELSER